MAYHIQNTFVISFSKIHQRCRWFSLYLSLSLYLSVCLSLYLYFCLNFDSWHHQLSENIRFEGYLRPNGCVTAHLWTQEKLLRKVLQEDLKIFFYPIFENLYSLRVLCELKRSMKNQKTRVGLMQYLCPSVRLPSKSSKDPSNLTVDPLGPCRSTPWPHGSLYAYPFSPWDPFGLSLDPLGPCRSNPCPHGTLIAHALAPWDPEGLPFQRATLKKALVSKYNYILASAAPGTISLSLRWRHFNVIFCWGPVLDSLYVFVCLFVNAKWMIACTNLWKEQPCWDRVALGQPSKGQRGPC